MTKQILIQITVLTWFHFSCGSQFGKLPSGERVERVKKSSNYKKEFQNLNNTLVFSGDAGFFGLIKEMFHSSSKRKPNVQIPSRKINLKVIDPGKNVLVWFGHSSYFMQIDGKKFLVDPVFSGHASPYKFSIRVLKEVTGILQQICPKSII